MKRTHLLQAATGYLTDLRQRAGLRPAIEPELELSLPTLADPWVEHVTALLSESGRAQRYW